MTEDWVTSRTGHRSSVLIKRDQPEAPTIQKLALGRLEPLHETIPDVAEMRSVGAGQAGAEKAGATHDPYLALVGERDLDGKE